MRVALIAPPSPFLMDQGVHGPLGLWHLGAALKRVGHHVTYCDMGLGDALPDAEVWCLTGTTPQRDMMASVAEVAHGRGIPLIIGGPHASSEPEDALCMGGTVVVGEGEEELPRLLEGPLPQLAIVKAPRIRNLDAVPWPDRSQARRYHYTLKDKAGVEHECTTAITSRGCPHKCAFCSTGVWQRKYTARSAENVLGEVAEIRDRWGYDAIHFYDDSLALDARRLKAICDGMQGIVWRCFVRSDQMTPERLQDMARAGCVEVGIGVESGSERILRNIHKGETAAKQAEAIGWAHEAGIRVKAFVIVGLPGEDWYSIDETARFVEKTKPDDVDFTVLQVFPGSDIAADPDGYGVTVSHTGGWFKGKPGQYEVNHRTEALTGEQLRAARDYLEARYKRWA